MASPIAAPPQPVRFKIAKEITKDNAILFILFFIVLHLLCWFRYWFYYHRYLPYTSLNHNTPLKNWTDWLPTSNSRHKSPWQQSHSIIYYWYALHIDEASPLQSICINQGRAESTNPITSYLLHPYKNIQKKTIIKGLFPIIFSLGKVRLQSLKHLHRTTCILQSHA